MFHSPFPHPRKKRSQNDGGVSRFGRVSSTRTFNDHTYDMHLHRDRRLTRIVPMSTDVTFYGSYGLRRVGEPKIIWLFREMNCAYKILTDMNCMLRSSEVSVYPEAIYREVEDSGQCHDLTVLAGTDAVPRSQRSRCSAR